MQRIAALSNLDGVDMSASGRNWSVSMIAWGQPSDPRSFSGYSHYLTRALEAQSRVRREFSAKCIGYSDWFRGAYTFTSNGRRVGKPVVSRKWMWSHRGQQTLTRRFAEKLRASGDRGAFLQIGTLVEVPPDLGPHYVLTDMTIPQAARVGMFDVGKLSGDHVREAVEVQKRVLDSARHVFVLTDWCKRSMVADFGLADDKVTVVYAGANLPIPLAVKQSRNDEEILFVGIDWERKGGPLLIDAFRLLRQRLPGAKLRIAGCAPHGLADEPGVSLEGFFDKRDPAQYEKLCRLYLRSSVFCLPSQFDPFPNVIIEAASVGLASVAIDNGSRREAILDGVTGHLADPTPASVADALWKTLSDRNRCRVMGTAAKAHATAQFTWESVIVKIERIIGSANRP